MHMHTAITGTDVWYGMVRLPMFLLAAFAVFCLALKTRCVLLTSKFALNHTDTRAHVHTVGYQVGVTTRMFSDMDADMTALDSTLGDLSDTSADTAELRAGFDASVPALLT